MLIDFREKWWYGERKKRNIDVREKHHCMHPDWGQSLQPRQVS